MGDTYNITIRRDGGRVERRSTQDAAEGRRILIEAEQDPSVTEYDVNGDVGYRRDR